MDPAIVDMVKRELSGHPLRPVGDRPPHAGLAGDRPRHAWPCGRSPRHDRRRSARGAFGAGRGPEPPAEPRCACLCSSAPAFIAAAAGSPARISSRHEAPRAAMPLPPKPELPNPAAAQEFAKPIMAPAPRNISSPRRANSMRPSRPRRLPRPFRRARSAKSWCRTLRLRAPRSSRNCRRIIRWSRAHGRPRGCRRRRSASPLPKAR